METARTIKAVILHCADTPDYAEGDPRFDRFGAAEIRAWHLQQGWSDIGYHYVVRRTGVIEKGRPEAVVGAHCEGHNAESLGVCYLGRQSPTGAQLRSILALSIAFKERLGLEPKDWFGHYEFQPAKTCPGLLMPLVRSFLAYGAPTYT